MTGTQTPVRETDVSRRWRWGAYAAAVWSFAFAAVSFYWALGGTLGAETLGAIFTDPEVTTDPAFIAFVWLTAFLKVGIGLLALASLQPWESRLLQRLVRLAVWAAGILLTLYGLALLVQHGLMAVGTTPVPASIGSSAAVRWHLFLWDPFWLLGGLLFLLAARSSRRGQARHAHIEHQ